MPQWSHGITVPPLISKQEAPADEPEGKRQGCYYHGSRERCHAGRPYVVDYFGETYPPEGPGEESDRNRDADEGGKSPPDSAPRWGSGLGNEIRAGQARVVRGRATPGATVAVIPDSGPGSAR
jgi:hypothetical protein